MATVNAKLLQQAPRSATYLWETLTSANADGSAIDLGQFGKVSLVAQVTGTPGSATLTWQGSNDGSTWVALPQKGSIAGTDATAAWTAAEAAAAQAAAGMLEISRVPRFIRPNTAGGGGTQDLDALLHISW